LLSVFPPYFCRLRSFILRGDDELHGAPAWESPMRSGPVPSFVSGFRSIGPGRLAFTIAFLLLLGSSSRLIAAQTGQQNPHFTARTVSSSRMSTTPRMARSFFLWKHFLRLLQRHMDLDGSNWSQAAPANSPSQGLAGVAYDAAHHQVVLFGGYSADSSTGVAAWLGDTGSGTGQLDAAESSHQPFWPNQSARFMTQSAIAWCSSAARQRDNFLNDTWMWDGANWSQARRQPPSWAR